MVGLEREKSNENGFIAEMGPDELMALLPPETVRALQSPDLTWDQLRSATQGFDGGELVGTGRSDEVDLANGMKVTFHRDAYGNINLGASGSSERIARGM